MNLHRKEFLKLCGSFLVGATVPASVSFAQTDPFSEKAARFLTESGGPGLACAVITAGQVRWARGFGLADLESRRPMEADTLINVGSIAKTVTATAVMQLWERKKLSLGDDVGKYLPFPVRNPAFPETPITIEQLLTHRSSIKDGPAYDKSYVCGDSPLSLGDWLASYFTPGGKNWSTTENWHGWTPGTANPPAQPRAYSNVGFGVLGQVVERISRQPFSAYCQENIFRPLGMNRTGWFLRSVDVKRHATPYERLPANLKSAESEDFRALTPTGIKLDSLAPGSYVPRCLYGFPNYPDGLLRTSANELGRFMAMYLARGTAFGRQSLKPGTITEMFSKTHFGNCLGWRDYKLPDGRSIIGHGGADPGISTFAMFDPSFQVGALYLCNFEPKRDKALALLTDLIQAGLKAT